jgi:hypothetical protein
VLLSMKVKAKVKVKAPAAFELYAPAMYVGSVFFPSGFFDWPLKKTTPSTLKQAPGLKCRFRTSIGAEYRASDHVNTCVAYAGIMSQNLRGFDEYNEEEMLLRIAQRKAGADQRYDVEKW